MKKQITKKQRKELVKTLDNCQQILSTGYEKRKKILKKMEEMSKKKKK